jgi:excisionase family DNA binding protein
MLPTRQMDSIAETAKMHGVSEKTIRRWIAQGLIHGFRMGPRLIRVDRAEVEAMLRPIPTAGGDAA